MAAKALAVAAKARQVLQAVVESVVVGRQARERRPRGQVPLREEALRSAQLPHRESRARHEGKHAGESTPWASKAQRPNPWIHKPSLAAERVQATAIQHNTRVGSIWVIIVNQ